MNIRRKYKFAMKALAVVSILAVVAVTGIAAGEPVASVLPVYVAVPADCPQLKSAYDAFRKQQMEACLKELKHAVEDYPQFPPPRLLIAQMFFNAGDYPHARAVLEEAVSESPSRPEVYLLFAQLASMERRVTDAQVHLEKAALLPLPSHWPEAQKTKFLAQLCAGRATVAESRKNWPDVQRELESLLKFEPKDGIARQRYAMAIFIGESRSFEPADRDSKVLKQLMQAAADVPSLEPPEVTLAYFYAALGNMKRASDLLQAAIAEHPKDARVYFRLATWELNQGRALEAGKLSAQAAQLGLESRDLRFTRGLVARQLHELEHAERFFDGIYRESPGDFEAASQLALVLAEQADAEKQKRGLQIAETLARQFPQSPDALSTLGWVHYKMGHNGQAEQYLRLSTAGGSLKSDPAYYLARVLGEKGASDDATKAAEILQAALEKTGSLFVLREEAREWLKNNTPPESGKQPAAASADDLFIPEKKKPSS